MPRARSGHPARKNLSPLLEERRENLGLLVVNEVGLIYAEPADFLFADEAPLAPLGRSAGSAGAALWPRSAGSRWAGRCGWWCLYGCVFICHSISPLLSLCGGLFTAARRWGRSCRSRLARAARGAALAMAFQLFLTLQFFIQTHGKILHHRVRNFQPALELFHHFAVARFDHQVNVIPLAQFLDAIGHASPAPLVHLLDFAALLGGGMLERGNHFVHIRLRCVRTADENQIVLALFHVSSIRCELNGNSKNSYSESSSSGETRRFNCVIALLTPSFKIVSTALLASSTSWVAISRSARPMGQRT